MFLLTENNIAAYLRDTGRLPAGAAARVTALGGGVSNAVYLVEPDGGEPARGEAFVLKQAREQLRTRAEWFARPERIFREAAFLRLVEPWLAKGSLPRVRFEDRQNFAFAMDAVPAGHRVWKQDLLGGRFDANMADAAAEILGTVHARSAHAALDPLWDDASHFEELRLSPYYRHLLPGYPELRPHLEDLIDSTLATRGELVHADFSPKNLLVSAGRLTLVDCETAHRGDAAFDLGFFLTHLLLKAVHHRPRHEEVLALAGRFWTAYRATYRRVADQAVSADRESRAVRHLAACSLARVDGKSPVDYLDAPSQALVRRLAVSLIMDPPPTLAHAFRETSRACGAA